MKQSIYRFRLADPEIFRDYAETGAADTGSIPLAENFRSRESLLNFVNSVFSLVMREEIGGVKYDEEAQLRFGVARKHRDSLCAARRTTTEPRVELLLRLKTKAAEVSDDENR